MTIETKNEDETKSLGESIGKLLKGGEIIELIGDVGSGKTTLVKGIAVGLGINDYIQSPSFTINRVYDGRGRIQLSHYDFFRLEDAGIMANELQEVIDRKNIVTIIEWGGVVKGVLPNDRLTINIISTNENSRKFDIFSGGSESKKVMDKIKI